MALKEDFEYTTFRCAFCNALNPARKSRPVAPRLSVMPAAGAIAAAGSDTSDTDDDKDSGKMHLIFNLFLVLVFNCSGIDVSFVKLHYMQK